MSLAKDTDEGKDFIESFVCVCVCVCVCVFPDLLVP